MRYSTNLDTKRNQKLFKKDYKKQQIRKEQGDFFALSFILVGPKSTYMYIKAIENYLISNGHQYIDLKSVLFDMDGVLYDSMPYHAISWHNTMKKHGLNFEEKDAYLHEGRKGVTTIKVVSEAQLGETLRQDAIQEIYKEKTVAFNNLPKPKRIAGSWDLIKQIKENELTSMVVTGSAQLSMLDRLNESFPNTFTKENIITAFDVKVGKPHPEPYLAALQKGNFKANEAVVVENAPLGIEAAHAAGIFTIAVNTGPLDDQVLLDAGADLLFHSMKELSSSWKKLYLQLKETGKIITEEN